MADIVADMEVLGRMSRKLRKYTLADVSDARDFVCSLSSEMYLAACHAPSGQAPACVAAFGRVEALRSSLTESADLLSSAIRGLEDCGVMDEGSPAPRAFDLSDIPSAPDFDNLGF